MCKEGLGWSLWTVRLSFRAAIMNGETMYFQFPHFLVDMLSSLGLINQDRPIEPQFIQLLCFAMFLVGIIVFLILLFVPAVYGRYTGPNSLFGFGVNAKVAWFLQESPSFLVPISLCLLNHEKGREINFVQSTLAGLFILHYWQRYNVWNFLSSASRESRVLQQIAD